MHLFVKTYVNLDTVLAKIGYFCNRTICRIPLSQSKLDFSLMDMEFRETFMLKVDMLLSEYKASKLAFESFSREYGYSLHYSASDVGYAIKAFISREDYANALACIVKYPLLMLIHSSHVLKDGIQLAIENNSRLMKECSESLSHKRIRSGKTARYVILNEKSISANPVFELEQIGLMLLHAIRV